MVSSSSTTKTVAISNTLRKRLAMTSRCHFGILSYFAFSIQEFCADVSAISFVSEGIVGRNPVHNQPVKPQGLNGFAKLIKIHWFLNVTIHSKPVTFDKVPLLP